MLQIFINVKNSFFKKSINNRHQRDFFEKSKRTNIVKFRNFLFKNNIYLSGSGLFLSNNHMQKDLLYLFRLSKKHSN